MDQLQNDLVRYQSSGSNPEPPTANALGQYQPAGNNETPLAGDELNSDAIVNAQLTHLISRDDASQGQDAPNVPDVLMPDGQCMTSPLRDARLVEDAASGASVHNQPQVNASVLPVICVEYDSHMVKRVYNSGATVKPITTTYMHIVSMEGLGHDHELFLKQATDQDAVDAVTRQRDTITRTAALPFAQDPDQASTAAPPDDERHLFGREEALRMDEEIMDFQ